MSGLPLVLPGPDVPKGRELSLLALCGRSFNVSQGGREMIAQGKQHKFPMASVDGEFVSCSVPEGFARAPIGFNPRAQHLLVDPAGHAIHNAEELWGRETVSMPAPPWRTTQSYQPPQKKKGAAPGAARLRPIASRLYPQFELCLDQGLKTKPQI